MLTLLLVTLMSCPAPACSCVAIPAPAEAVAQAGIVFEGTPVRVRDTLTPRVGYDGKPFTSRQLRFTVLVSRPWKGVVGDTVDVITGTGGGNCGYPFEIGQHYLIFPDDSAGSAILNVSLCSDTKPTAEAEAELQVLRARAAGRS